MPFPSGSDGVPFDEVLAPEVATYSSHLELVGCSGRSSQVLADVGDGQSLQQSLSTFSAHVRRLRLILAATTPASLVLLDEVGSGGPGAGLQPPALVASMSLA